MADLKEIKNQVKEVIEYSQELSGINTDDLINQWYDAKSRFIKIFDDNLIYRTKEPVTIELSSDEKNAKLQEFFNEISSSYNYPGLIDFIEYFQNDFFENKMSSAYHRHGYDIPAGMKLTKAYKEFVPNEKDLDAIQTIASRLIQENKITGYLCLSVHPLDYLSMSENTNKWRSCHALNGEYRAGNLSYMLDSSTIVCYLCGDEKTKLPRFPKSVPWNSKKWRMLLFVSDDNDGLFAGRHYPFFSSALMNMVQDMWSHHNRWAYWSHWHDDQIKTYDYKEWNFDSKNLCGTYIPFNGRIYEIEDLITDRSELHFNDLKKSSFYTPYYCWKDSLISTKTHFRIGSKVKCLKCGSRYLKDSNSMICDNCLEIKGYERCSDCEEIYPGEEMIWIDSENRYVCPSCFENYYCTCAYCGEIIRTSRAYWDENRDAYYCQSCLEELGYNEE